MLDQERVLNCVDLDLTAEIMEANQKQSHVLFYYFIRDIYVVSHVVICSHMVVYIYIYIFFVLS